MNIKEKVNEKTTKKAKLLWNSQGGYHSYYDKNYTTKEDFIDKLISILSGAQPTRIESIWKEVKEMEVVDCFNIALVFLYTFVNSSSYQKKLKVGNHTITSHDSFQDPIKTYSTLLKIEKEDKDFTFLKENITLVKERCITVINEDSVLDYINLYKKGCLGEIKNLFKHIKGNNLSPTKKGLNIAIAVLSFTEDAKIFDKITEIYSLVRKTDPTFSNVKINLLEKELLKGEAVYPKEELDKMDKLLHDQTIFEDIEKTFSVCVDIEKVTMIQKQHNEYHYNSSGADFILNISKIIEKAKQMDIFLFKDYVSPKEILSKIDFLSKGKTSVNKLHAEVVRRFEFVYEDENDLEAKREAIKSFLTAASKLESDTNDSVYINLMKDISFKFKLEQQIAIPEKSVESVAKKRNKI